MTIFISSTEDAVCQNDERFEQKYLKFIIRSKENRKFEEIESFLETEKSIKWND